MYTITSSAGNTIEVSYVSDYLPGVPQFAVTIDGEIAAKATTITTLGRPMEAKGKTIVAVLELRKHHMKGVGMKGVGLTAEQVEAIQAEAEANRTDEQRERITIARLRSQRESLAREISITLDEAYPDNLYESEYEHVNLRRQAEARAAEAKLPAARAALAAFDVEHQEIIAMVEAEKAASIERNMWN